MGKLAGVLGPDRRTPALSFQAAAGRPDAEGEGLTMLRGVWLVMQPCVQSKVSGSVSFRGYTSLPVKCKYHFIDIPVAREK